MPTELDKKVSALQAAKRELSDLIAKFNAAKKELIDHLKTIWTPDRVVRYQKDNGIVDDAESDASLKEFLNLKKMYKQSKTSLNGRQLDKYLRLEERFSAYSQVDFKDIMIVRVAFFKYSNDIEDCAQKLMKGVAEYKARMSDAIAMAQKETELEDQKVKELERALKLYAIVDEEPPTSESMPKLLLSERIKAVGEMIKTGFFGKCSFADALKVDCLHRAHKRLLEQAKLEASALTAEKIRVYQYQNVDTTKVHPPLTLGEMANLIGGAAINCVVVENLAPILGDMVDVSAVEDEANRECAKLLVADPGVNESNMGEIYDIIVNSSGEIVSSEAKITETEDYFERIRQDDSSMHLPYAAWKGGFPYGEYTPSTTVWAMEEYKALDSALFEFEQ